MLKYMKTFESINDEIVLSYIFGLPSGEVIDVTKDDIISLKKERLVKYDNKYRSFTFLDLNRDSVIKMINKNKNTLESIFNFMDMIGISKNDFHIYDNMSIDVFCDVDISQRGLTKIPFKFNLVEGDFDCNMNRLQTLTNSPSIVFGAFDCSYNKIYTLIGGPKSVKKGYYCNNNNLDNLEGYPNSCDDIFDASSNQLISLFGVPDKITSKEFDVSRNRIKSLKSGPIYTNDFNCSFNLLTTLVGSPKEVHGVFDCTHNKLTNLLGVPVCNKLLYTEGNNIEEFEDYT